MDRLPIEVQLLYLEHLDVVDIIHLQQTCKRIFSLVEQFAEVIWRHCLRRQCERNGLLWASYSHLSKASDLKNACATIPRFHHVYKRAANEADVSVPLTIPSTISGLSVGRREILDFYTVPGGRFLLSFESTQLSLWDLHSLRDGRNSSPLCSIHKESNEATIFVNVISISKLHILLLTDVVEIGPSDSDDKEWSTSLELLELVTEGQDRNPQLEMRRVGRLGFIHAEDDWSAIYSFANCQGKLAFYSVGGATVVWDPIPGRGAGWRLDGVVDVMEIFCNDDFVMYLNPEGIHAIKIPDLQPLENGQITFSFFEATRLAPTFSLPYSHSHSFTTGFHSGNIVFPAICQPDRPLVFVVKETLSEAMIHGYWYQFDFNQTCPRESTFKMVGSFRLPTPHINALHLMSYPYHLCGDMAAIMWVDENDEELDALLFSLCSPTTTDLEVLSLESHTRSESTPPSTGDGQSDSGLEAATTKTSGVEPLRLAHIMRGPTSCIKPTFCPGAGQAAILWTSDEFEEGDSQRPSQSIDLYDFVNTE